MSGEEIYAALVRAAGASSSFASPTQLTTTPQDLGGDAQGDRVYQALLAAAAAARTEGAVLTSPTPAPNAPLSLKTDVKVVQFATVSTSKVSPASLGFMSDRMDALPSAFSALIGALLIILALGALTVGARSMLFGNQWGRKRGTMEGKANMAGGLGGIAFGGSALGGLGALLTLVIISRQADPSLGSWGTLAIVFCSSILGGVLGGRFRWAARGCCALVGGTSLVLLFSLSFRLSTILPRLTLLAIFLPICLLLAFLPRTTHSLSVFSGLTGAFLLVLGVDLFVHLGFVDALGLLVAPSGVSVKGKATEMVVQWGTGGGKGLIAGWWLLAIISSAWQWWWGGENGEVDETWNSYLSTFITSNPSPRGTYSPPRSFLARLFTPSPARPSAAFTDIPGRRRRSPWDEEEKTRGHGEETSDAWDSDVDAATLRESLAPARYKARGGESDSEEEEEDDDDELNRVKRGLWSPKGGAGDFDEEMSMGVRKVAGNGRLDSILSGSTMVGAGGSMGKSFSGGSRADADADEDARLVASLPTLSAATDKKPSTMRSFFSSKSSKPASYRSGDSPLATAPSSPPPNAVPATPSLIHALNRVKEAQKQARGGVLSTHRQTPSPPVPQRPRVASGGSDGSERGRRASYDEWWKEVISKGGK